MIYQPRVEFSPNRLLKSYDCVSQDDKMNLQ